MSQEPTECHSREGKLLFDRLRARDPQALDDIAKTYGDALSRAAYLQLADAAAVEDVVQETLLGAWDGAGRARPGTPVGPWLFGILFNQCRKYRRRLWRRLRRERSAAAWPATSSLTPEEVERRQRLKEALGRLSADLRAVVVLRHEEGLSVAETAEALGIPEGTVSSRAHAAIEKLREYLRRDV